MPGVVAWLDARRHGMWTDSQRFDPHFRQHTFVEIGLEIISTTLLSLMLILEGQLSVTGERMCTMYW